MPLVFPNAITDIGAPKESANLSKASCLFLVKPGVYFATTVLAAVQANWLAKIASGDIIPILKIDEEEIKDTETNVKETSTGRTIKNFDGIYKRVYTVTQDIDSHKKMMNLNGTKFNIYIGDMNGQVIGTSSDGTKFEPCTTGYFNVENVKMGDGWSTVITINYADSSEINKRLKVIDVDFALSTLEPIYPATIVSQTTVNQTTSVFTIAVAYVSTAYSNNAGVAESYPITGLAKENILLVNTSAPTVGITPESCVESTTIPGTYVVTCKTPTAFLAGTCEIVATASNLYKSAQVTLVAAT